MAILRTSKSRWIVGTIALLVISVGTLIGLPTNGQKQHLPINMPTTAAVPYFAPVTPKGVVPNDVLDALLVPKNSTRTSWHNFDQGSGQFDREITIAVHASYASTKSFFDAALKDMAWRILSSQPLGKGYEILALHSGSDGHFWEIGVTIAQNPPNAPKLPTSSEKPGGSTSATLRLLQYVSA